MSAREVNPYQAPMVEEVVQAGEPPAEVALTVAEAAALERLAPRRSASELVELTTCSTAHEALLVQSVLRGAGIASELRDHGTVGANALLSIAVGGVKILVGVEDVDRARERLEASSSNEGRPVFMVVRRPYVGYGIIGAFVGLFLAGSAYKIFGHRIVILVVEVVCVVIGFWFASSTPGYCSAFKCGRELDPDMTVCPGCKGTVSGVIRRPKDRLDAEERLRLEKRGIR